MELRAGQFTWSADTVLALEAGNKADRRAAETLFEACRESGIPTPRIIEPDGTDLPAGGNCVLAGDPCRNLPLAAVLRKEGVKTVPPELADDGYVLDITPDRILLYGNTPAGVYYGFQSLIQFLRAVGPGRQLPALQMADWTDLTQRGISMDFGRGEVYTVEAVKRDIQCMAHYKLNCLVLYLEDAFLFPSHPDIGEDRDRLTTAEALDLDAFARRHHVEVIPFFDSPSHMERTLAHPRYAHLAEGAETPALRQVIDVSNPESYALLRDLYTDLSKAFPSRFLHIGGDEAMALGKGKSKSLADQVGVEALYLRHLKRLRDILAEHGKRMIVAADPFEPDFFKAFGAENYGIAPLLQLPRDVVLQPWHYGRTEQFPFGDQARALGFEQQLWSSMEAHHGFFPLLRHSMENVETFIPFGHRQKALGVLHSNWGDRVSFREYNWPGIVHFSEWAWRVDGRSGDTLLPAAVASLYGPQTAELAGTLRFLCNSDHYFPWAVQFLDHAGGRLFFESLEPRELDPGQLALLDSFRRDGAEARATYNRTRRVSVRNKDYFDFMAFALDQADILGDLVECRHDLARKDAASRTRAREMLEKLSQSLPALVRQFDTLWHRARRPLGLAANKQRFERVIAWIDQARAGQVQTQGRKQLP